MYDFLIKDDKMLKEHNEIQQNVTNITYKAFDINPAYNEK